MKSILAAFVLGTAGLLAAASAAAGDAGLALQLKDHHFTPAEPAVPANVRLKITVTNLDATPSEFESDDLKVEKIIAAGQTVAVTVGPLKPGTYEFYDDYNEDDSRTHLIAK